MRGYESINGVNIGGSLGSDTQFYWPKCGSFSYENGLYRAVWGCAVTGGIFCA